MILFQEIMEPIKKFYSFYNSEKIFGLSLIFRYMYTYIFNMYMNVIEHWKSLLQRRAFIYIIYRYIFIYIYIHRYTDI